MARDMVIRISEGVRRQFTQERFIAAEYDRAYSLTSMILFSFPHQQSDGCGKYFFTYLLTGR